MPFIWAWPSTVKQFHFIPAGPSAVKHCISAMKLFHLWRWHGSWAYSMFGMWSMIKNIPKCLKTSFGSWSVITCWLNSISVVQKTELSGQRGQGFFSDSLALLLASQSSCPSNWDILCFNLKCCLTILSETLLRFHRSHLNWIPADNNFSAASVITDSVCLVFPALSELLCWIISWTGGWFVTALSAWAVASSRRRSWQQSWEGDFFFGSVDLDEGRGLGKC